ncbi:hypothetical protein [Streptomyces sp. cg35]|uniref:hypothetical protein n=1 Tax=Streptomyces sp. cg35 TaxID=3421650 RepID=UPI003D16765B
MAGQDAGYVTAYHSDCDNPDHSAAAGRFWNEGDKFWVEDICPDGHRAVLQVDAGAAETGERYDWKVEATGGFGDEKTVVHNYTEGTTVQIRACVYEGSTKLSCSKWDQGEA